MEIKDIQKTKKKASKRVGRGNGSGHGTFSCRGMKGQSARSGGRRRPGFEGGQTPFLRKIPKLKGFRNINRTEYQVVNLKDLNSFAEGAEVNAETLIKKGLINSINSPVKLLGYGVCEVKNLKITVDRASKTVKEILEKNSCEIKEII